MWFNLREWTRFTVAISILCAWPIPSSPIAAEASRGLASDRSEGNWDRYFSVTSTVRFEKSDSSFGASSTALVAVSKTVDSDGWRATYDYQCGMELLLGDTASFCVAQTTIPEFTLIRDIASDRFAGGSESLAKAAQLSNLMLDLIPTAATSDTSYDFRLYQPDQRWPDSLACNLHKQFVTTAALGTVCVSRASFESIVFESTDHSGARRITARHTTICVTDETIENVYCSISRFEAIPDNALDERLVLENCIRQVNSGGVYLDLTGLEDIFSQSEDLLDLDTTEIPGPPDLPLPEWALQALVVHDLVNVTGGAVIEGSPNFVACLSIGTLLLIDAGISAATSLAHEFGWIDSEYPGLTNLLGQSFGLLAAESIELGSALAGNELDLNEEQFMFWGGVGGDLGVLLVPGGWLNHGLTIKIHGLSKLPNVSGWVVKSYRGARVSFGGVKGEAWLSLIGPRTASQLRLSEYLKFLQKVINLGKLGLTIEDHFDATASGISPEDWGQWELKAIDQTTDLSIDSLEEVMRPLAGYLGFVQADLQKQLAEIDTTGLTDDEKVQALNGHLRADGQATAMHDPKTGSRAQQIRQRALLEKNVQEYSWWWAKVIEWINRAKALARRSLGAMSRGEDMTALRLELDNLVTEGVDLYNQLLLTLSVYQYDAVRLNTERH